MDSRNIFPQIEQDWWEAAQNACPLHNANCRVPWVTQQWPPHAGSISFMPRTWSLMDKVAPWCACNPVINSLCGCIKDQSNQCYLTDGYDEGRQQEHGHGHPGDVGLQPPRLSKVTPAFKHSRSHFWAREDEHLTDTTRHGGHNTRRQNIR